MLHIESVPLWAWLLIAAIIVMTGLVALFSMVRRRGERKVHRERLRKSLAHQRAWDWIMGRRALRLTDKRQSQGTGKG